MFPFSRCCSSTSSESNLFVGKRLCIPRSKNQKSFHFWGHIFWIRRNGCVGNLNFLHSWSGSQECFLFAHTYLSAGNLFVANRLDLPGVRSKKHFDYYEQWPSEEILWIFLPLACETFDFWDPTIHQLVIDKSQQPASFLSLRLFKSKFISQPWKVWS